MSNDWQKKIEKGKQKLAEREEKRKQEQEEREHREYLAKLAALERRFVCCVCGKGSKMPETRTYGSHSEGFTETTNWDIPGDLSRCPRCKRWVCYKDTCSVSQGDYKYIEKYWGLYKKVLEPGNYCKSCALWIFS